MDTLSPKSRHQRFRYSQWSSVQGHIVHCLWPSSCSSLSMGSTLFVSMVHILSDFSSLCIQMYGEMQLMEGRVFFLKITLIYCFMPLSALPTKYLWTPWCAPWTQIPEENVRSSRSRLTYGCELLWCCWELNQDPLE